MAKLQEINGRYFIYVPKDIIKIKEWKKGQDVLFFVSHKDKTVRLVGVEE